MTTTNTAFWEAVTIILILLLILLFSVIHLTGGLNLFGSPKHPLAGWDGDKTKKRSKTEEGDGATRSGGQGTATDPQAPVPPLDQPIRPRGERETGPSGAGDTSAQPREEEGAAGQPGPRPPGTPAGVQVEGQGASGGDSNAVPGTAPLGSASSSGSGASASPVSTPVDSPAGEDQGGIGSGGIGVPALSPSVGDKGATVTYHLVDREGKPLTKIRMVGVDPSTQLGIRTAGTAPDAGPLSGFENNGPRVSWNRAGQEQEEVVGKPRVVKTPLPKPPAPPAGLPVPPPDVAAPAGGGIALPPAEGPAGSGQSDRVPGGEEDEMRGRGGGGDEVDEEEIKRALELSDQSDQSEEEEQTSPVPRAVPSPVRTVQLVDIGQQHEAIGKHSKRRSPPSPIIVPKEGMSDNEADAFIAAAKAQKQARSQEKERQRKAKEANAKRKEQEEEEEMKRLADEEKEAKQKAEQKAKELERAAEQGRLAKDEAEKAAEAAEKAMQAQEANAREKQQEAYNLKQKLKAAEEARELAAEELATARKAKKEAKAKRKAKGKAKANERKKSKARDEEESGSDSGTGSSEEDEQSDSNKSGSEETSSSTEDEAPAGSSKEREKGTDQDDKSPKKESSKKGKTKKSKRNKKGDQEEDGSNTAGEEVSKKKNKKVNKKKAADIMDIVTTEGEEVETDGGNLKSSKKKKKARGDREAPGSASVGDGDYESSGLSEEDEHSRGLSRSKHTGQQERGKSIETGQARVKRKKARDPSKVPKTRRVANPGYEDQDYESHSPHLQDEAARHDLTSVKATKAEEARAARRKIRAENMADQRGLGPAGEVEQDATSPKRSGAGDISPLGAVSYSKPERGREERKNNHKHPEEETSPVDLPERTLKTLPAGSSPDHEGEEEGHSRSTSMVKNEVTSKIQIAQQSLRGQTAESTVEMSNLPAAEPLLPTLKGRKRSTREFGSHPPGSQQEAPKEESPGNNTTLPPQLLAPPASSGPSAQHWQSRSQQIEEESEKAWEASKAQRDRERQDRAEKTAEAERKNNKRVEELKELQDRLNQKYVQGNKGEIIEVEELSSEPLDDNNPHAQSTIIEEYEPHASGHGHPSKFKQIEEKPQESLFDFFKQDQSSSRPSPVLVNTTRVPQTHYHEDMLAEIVGERHRSRTPGLREAEFAPAPRTAKTKRPPPPPPISPQSQEDEIETSWRQQEDWGNGLVQKTKKSARSGRGQISPIKAAHSDPLHRIGATKGIERRRKDYGRSARVAVIQHESLSSPEYEDPTLLPEGLPRQSQGNQGHQRPQKVQSDPDSGYESLSNDGSSSPLGPAGNAILAGEKSSKASGTNARNSKHKDVWELQNVAPASREDASGQRVRTQLGTQEGSTSAKWDDINSIKGFNPNDYAEESKVISPITPQQAQNPPTKTRKALEEAKEEALPWMKHRSKGPQWQKSDLENDSKDPVTIGVKQKTRQKDEVARSPVQIDHPLSIVSKRSPSVPEQRSTSYNTDDLSNSSDNLDGHQTAKPSKSKAAKQSTFRVGTLERGRRQSKTSSQLLKTALQKRPSSTQQQMVRWGSPDIGLAQQAYKGLQRAQKAPIAFVGTFGTGVGVIAGPRLIASLGPAAVGKIGQVVPTFVKRDTLQSGGPGGPEGQAMFGLSQGVIIFMAINIYLIISIPLWLWTIEQFLKISANPEKYRRMDMLRKVGRCLKYPRRWCRWGSSSCNPLGTCDSLKQIIFMCNSPVIWKMLWRHSKLRLVIMICFILAAVGVGRQLHGLVLVAGGQQDGSLLDSPDLQATKKTLTSISSNLQGPGAFTLLNLFIMVAVPCLLYAVYNTCNPQPRQISIRLPSIRSLRTMGKKFKHPAKLYKKLPSWVREMLVIVLVLAPYVGALLGYGSMVALAEQHLGHITGLQAFAVLNLIFAVFAIPLAFVMMKVGRIGKKLWKKVSCAGCGGSGRRRRAHSAV